MSIMRVAVCYNMHILFTCGLLLKAFLTSFTLYLILTNEYSDEDLVYRSHDDLYTHIYIYIVITEVTNAICANDRDDNNTTSCNIVPRQ